MGFLAGKRLLITGVLSNRSIAYGIAKACRREGAEIALSYVGERFRDRSLEFGREFDTDMVYECDVGSDEHIERLFAQLGERWDQFDGFVHAIAFAPREAIAGDFLDGLTRENFRRHCTFVNYVAARAFAASEEGEQPLVTGDDLIAELDLPGGRLLGAVLTSVRRAQLEGAVSTKPEALALARSVLETLIAAE